MKTFAVLISTLLLSTTASAGAFRGLGTCSSFQGNQLNHSVTIYMNLENKNFYADIWSDVQQMTIAYRVPMTSKFELTLAGNRMLSFKSVSSETPLEVSIHKDLYTKEVTAELSVQLADGTILTEKNLRCGEDML